LDLGRLLLLLFGLLNHFGYFLRLHFWLDFYALITFGFYLFLLLGFLSWRFGSLLGWLDLFFTFRWAFLNNLLSLSDWLHQWGFGFLKGWFGNYFLGWLDLLFAFFTGLLLNFFSDDFSVFDWDYFLGSYRLLFLTLFAWRSNLLFGDNSLLGWWFGLNDLFGGFLTLFFWRWNGLNFFWGSILSLYGFNGLLL